MKPALSPFAARLREFISSEGQVPRRLDPDGEKLDGDSSNSSLRKDEAFNRLALELFALQFAHNTPYSHICEALGSSPRNVEHWTRIPVVPTGAFKELELTCLPIAERTTVFHSSGTMEQRPSRHFHNAESLAVYEASLWEWFAQHVLADPKSGIANLRLVILTPPPPKAPSSSLVHMFDVVRCKLRGDANAFVGRVDKDGSWLVNFGSACWEMECSRRDRRPVLLLGTAFSFVHLMDTLAGMKMSFRLPPGSRVMETGGYKGRSRSLLKAELHALLTERLGVPASHIVCEYGMSELSSQAYDRVSGVTCQVSDKSSAITHCAARGFRFPPWARAQIISPETGQEVAGGETGLLRVFDLANVFSVMAIQTEDLGIRRGDGFELIGRAELAEPRGCSLMTV